MGRRQRANVVPRSAKDVDDAARRRKEIIDRHYCRCKYCGFFMQRKFEGDDVCDAPRCMVLNETEVDE